ncbi:CDGSH iron-sulfur domain-containing protein [Aeromicrobium sp. CF4.19]|uniref:CDGSH iron-sulfur domain-containing protein n=1 Tax=Aeromicrobium sp. CF4.19 TaxID=3373082 RepID=UPI003EE4D69C
MSVPGPRLVRGVGFVVDAAGATTRAQRPVVAICRCEASARAPWCDGTHKVLAERERRSRS